jgi:hypothetical protein
MAAVWSAQQGALSSAVTAKRQRKTAGLFGDSGVLSKAVMNVPEHPTQHVYIGDCHLTRPSTHSNSPDPIERLPPRQWRRIILCTALAISSPESKKQREFPTAPTLFRIGTVEPFPSTVLLLK